MPHKSLRQGRTRRTPAMAIGLTDHVWSYREYIWLPVHADPALDTRMQDQVAHLLTPARQDQPKSKRQAKVSPVEARNMQTTEDKEAESVPIPQAA